MRVLCLLLGSVLFSACNNTNDPGTVQTPTESKAADSAAHSELDQSHVPKSPPDTIPYNVQVDTVINLSFAKDSTSLTARGSINKKSEPVICYLKVDKACTINGTIIPGDSQLNIRFSQIIMPDQKSDGPFTRQIKYDLKQAGVYKIIIAPNNMAEGKRSGDFSLRLAHM